MIIAWNLGLKRPIHAQHVENKCCDIYTKLLFHNSLYLTLLYFCLYNIFIMYFNVRLILINSYASLGNFLHLIVLSTMPYTLYNLSIWIIHDSISMHLTSIKFSYIFLFVKPSKCSLTLHLSVDEWSFILSCLCFHSSRSNFQVSRKHTFIVSISSIHEEFTLSFHITASEWSIILFSVCPSVNGSIILFYSFYKVTFIEWSIRVSLNTFSMWLIIQPLSFIFKSSWTDKDTISIKLCILDLPSLVRAVGVDIDSIITSYITPCKTSFKKWSVIEIQFTRTFRITASPASIVISIVFVEIMNWECNPLLTRTLNRT